MSDQQARTPADADDAADGTVSTAKKSAQGRQWATFQQARARLAEVMSDDELRAFGFDLEVLDSRP